MPTAKVEKFKAIVRDEKVKENMKVIHVTVQGL